MANWYHARSSIFGQKWFRFRTETRRQKGVRVHASESLIAIATTRIFHTTRARDGLLLREGALASRASLVIPPRCIRYWSILLEGHCAVGLRCNAVCNELVISKVAPYPSSRFTCVYSESCSCARKIFNDRLIESVTYRISFVAISYNYYSRVSQVQLRIKHFLRRVESNRSKSLKLSF